MEEQTKGMTKEMLFERLLKRNKELSQAQRAAQMIERLAGAVDECIGMLKEIYKVKDEEIREVMQGE